MELSQREKHSLRIVGAYIVFLVACLYLEWQDHSDTSPTESRAQDDRWRDRREQALQRLENGGSIKVERWHGHDLVLRGDLVVDAEALGEPTTDEEQ